MNKFTYNFLSISGKIFRKLKISKNLPIYFFPSKAVDINVNESLNYLHNVYPDNGKSCVRQNFINHSPDYDIQIILPVFNVEKYLEKCIESILNQKTKASYYVTIIDDGSTDNSTKILEKYKKNRKIQIIHQENKGLSGARNTGLNYNNSNYIMFVDSDDKLPVNAIEKLYSLAIEKSHDIVGGGVYYCKSR